MARIPITKTPKVYVGGAFIRSESNRTFPVRDHSGGFVANIPQCTRKDLRNAVELAAKAGPVWSARTGYNRGQILYRLGEMLESRAGELADAIQIRDGGRGRRRGMAAREVSLSVDRLVHYAGWADKYEQLLGSVNPVAGPYFNFTVTEPMGVVGLLAPPADSLLGLVSLVAPAIVSGNVVVALASEVNAFPAILLGEMLATSDLPGGVVNILTGWRKELVPAFATHAHIRAVGGVASAEELRVVMTGAADSIKRVRLIQAEEIDWRMAEAEGLEWIADFLELKTTWHPIGS
jgi:aldehyde dehydrogenase (NAD+)